jgi:hypothetical protein
MPAAAQSRLARQCAAFGEAQCRKLGPSIDMVTALDIPPPASERLDAKAGSQGSGLGSDPARPAVDEDA